jgi:hypothetical protein
VLTVRSSGSSAFADYGHLHPPPAPRHSTGHEHPGQRSDTASPIWILTLRNDNVATISGGDHLRSVITETGSPALTSRPCLRRPEPDASGIYMIVGQVVKSVT